jgi:hypothetical protein
MESPLQTNNKALQALRSFCNLELNQQHARWNHWHLHTERLALEDSDP